MVKFAVCDDESEMSDYISDKLNEYYPEDCEIKKYTNGKILLNDCRQERFDAFFLDIGMTAPDGMELAEKINEENPNVKIVFVSNKEELAHMGYIYGAFRFVRKSKLETDLYETAGSLNKYFSAISNRMDFKIPNGTITKNASDIMYFEVKNHAVTMVCKSGRDRVCGTLAEYERKMQSRSFIRVHKGYLVNLRYVLTLEKTKVRLTNGGALPLSRNRIAEVKKKYREFMGNAVHP